MIDFLYQIEFRIENTPEVKTWLSSLLTENDFEPGDIQYVFCEDDYLHRLNQEYLGHDTLTDIITFDYSVGGQVNAEIYISVERVKDNASLYKVNRTEELHRVMAHGLLHCMGYKDKTKAEQERMKMAEDKALGLRTFI